MAGTGFWSDTGSQWAKCIWPPSLWVEATDLQVNDHETAQVLVKEQQVYPVPWVADPQTPLSAPKTEVATQFLVGTRHVKTDQDPQSVPMGRDS